MGDCVIKGLTVTENALGLTAVRLHYSCDPSKNPDTPEGAEWLERTRRRYPDPHRFAQEFEINWWIAQGTRVYPEFNETLHCPPIDGYRGTKVIYRAWDFGWHAPACLIAQIDSKDRLVLLKEIIGKEQTTRDFAKSVILRCAEWFPNHAAGYQDFCDPAGQQASSMAHERSEVRDVDVLKALAIYPKWEWGWNRKDGRALVHQLLQQRLDLTPSCYVSAIGCPVLVQGFLGKYVFPPKQGGTAHDEPDESNHPWADIHACLRYLATGLYSALGLRRQKAVAAPTRKVKMHGYGSPVRR